MTPEEKQLVTGLFDRLRQADGQGKDPEAEALISQAVAAQPASPYLLVQTLLVQEHALANAQTRIAALEKQVQQTAAAPPRSGGFLGGLFGSGAPSQPPAPPPQQAYQPQPSYQQPSYAPPPPQYAPTTSMAPSSGSGFLGSAVRTAAGVAGGALLFEGVSSLLSHNAGPFSGGMGGLGGGGGLLGGGSMFGGGGQPAPTEVVNNYYESPAGAPSGGYDQGAGAGGSDQSYDPPADPGYAPDGNDDPGVSNQDDDNTQV